MPRFPIAVLVSLLGLLSAGCGSQSAYCGSDSDCGGANPRCNPAARKCVPCLPTNDNCAKGSHCAVVNKSFACLAGCNQASDCPDATAKTACCKGTCTDTNTDTANCGGCGTVCASAANTAVTCLAGSCNIECAPGFTDCDKQPGNGCEVNTAADPKNCGTCGKVCGSGPRGAAACDKGTCKLNCSPGYADCDNDPTNGCEVNINADLNNCGKCLMACAQPANGIAACLSGTCGIASCRGGFLDCNGKVDDGCETNVSSDVANCGACGNACKAVQNGTAACSQGTCAIGTCNGGFANCSGNYADGCNTPVTSDPRNCGACNHICSGPHSTQTCSMSKCQVAMCQDGFSDCNKDPGDGCESQLAQDAKNCGACGMACPVLPHSASSCLASMCQPGVCDPGWKHCSMNPMDGCEVDITTVMNCGTCGKVCNVAHATPKCKGGMCAVDKCDDGFADCDGDPANGCESEQAKDPNNCGKCNNACPVPAPHYLPGCIASQCGFGACQNGYADCNKNQKDGCEIIIESDPKNCGACGNACGGNTPDCFVAACGKSIHNTVAWRPDGTQGFEGFNGLATFQYFYAGSLKWKDCMREASKRGAIAAGASSADWDQGVPYWFGHRNDTKAMCDQNDFYVSEDITTNQACEVVWDPQTINSNHKALLDSGVSYDGQHWTYQDYGLQFYDDCQRLAGLAGASIITPYTVGLGNGDNYWLGITNMFCGIAWSAAKGTAWNEDQSCNARFHQYSCMVGYPND